MHPIIYRDIIFRRSTDLEINYKPIDHRGNSSNYQLPLKLRVDVRFPNYLIHRSILRYHILKHKSTSSTKTRSEVQGGGRKPWKQKGTGKARAGSNRSPLWKGGGVIFGPKVKLKTYKLNKKESSIALQTLLYNKNNRVSVIDDFEQNFLSPKTKDFYNICKTSNIDLSKRVLFVSATRLYSLQLATRNIKTIELVQIANLTTMSLLKANQIIFTSLALKQFNKLLNGSVK